MGKASQVAGLDIGSQTIRMAVLERGANGGYNVVAAVGVPTDGVRKGAIQRIDEVAEAIEIAKNHIHKNTGIEVRHAYVGIGDWRITTHQSNGLVATTRADGEISTEDVRRSLQAAEEALPRLQNRQIIETVPLGYRVDGDQPILNPQGMQGMKLEASVLFVSAFYPFYKAVLETLDQARVHADDVLISHLAAADLLLSRRQREIGVMLCDFGAETTSMSVWEEDKLLSFEVVPIGSAHITQDVALGFQVDIATAERLKRSALTLAEGGKKEVRLAGFDKNIEQVYNQRKLEDIINARLGDIFELTNKHLKKISRAGLLPAGIVCTGGGSRLGGLLETAKKELQLPAQMGTLSGFSGKRELVDGPEWATVLGLCHTGFLREHGGGGESVFRSAAYQRIRRFIKQLIP